MITPEAVAAKLTPEARRFVLAADNSDALYAAYANHCAIQGKVPMTWHSWKREHVG